MHQAFSPTFAFSRTINNLDHAHITHLGNVYALETQSWKARVRLT